MTGKHPCCVLRCAVSSLLIVVAVALPVAAKEPLPPGLLAASVGEQVVLADPLTGGSLGIEAGQVGWLYPAPGGVLFAPDLVNGSTTVVDLRTKQVLDRLQGVTMPSFGGIRDRYVVVAREVLVVSYPERAFIAKVATNLELPWQSIVTDDDGLLLVLERNPDGDGGCALSAIDLFNRQVVYRRPLAGDVIRMAMSPQLRLVALAERVSRCVTLVEPSSLNPIRQFPVRGEPQDVAFTAGGQLLVMAVAHAERGELLLVQLKQTRKGLKVKKERICKLPAAPVRMAVCPWQQRLAVALAGGRIEVISLDTALPLATLALPDVPRDLVWCNPLSQGPLLAEWSDRRNTAPELSLSFRPPAK